MRKKIVIMALTNIVLLVLLIFAAFRQVPVKGLTAHAWEFSPIFYFSGRDALLDYCDFMDKWGEEGTPFRDDTLKMLFHDGYYLCPIVPDDWELIGVSCSQPYFLIQFTYKTLNDATVALKYSMDEVTRKNIKEKGFGKAKTADEYLRKRVIILGNEMKTLNKDGVNYYYDKENDELTWQQDGYFCGLYVSDTPTESSTFAGAAVFYRVFVKREEYSAKNVYLSKQGFSDDEPIDDIPTNRYITNLESMPIFKGEKFTYKNTDWMLGTQKIVLQSEHFDVEQYLNGRLASIYRAVAKGQPENMLAAEEAKAKAKQQIAAYLPEVELATLVLLQNEIQVYEGKECRKVSFEEKLNSAFAGRRITVTLQGSDMTDIHVLEADEQVSYVKITEAQAKRIAYKKINTSIKRLFLKPWLRYQTDYKLRKAVHGNTLFYIVNVTEYNPFHTMEFTVHINGMTGEVTYYIHKV